jgi:hypothetical protein
MRSTPDVKSLFSEFYACGTSSFAGKKIMNFEKKKKKFKCQKLEKKINKKSLSIHPNEHTYRLVSTLKKKIV